MHHAIAQPKADYVNQLLGIIDSKIQFLSFELSQKINTPSLPSSFGVETARAFDAIERVSRLKKLLLLIRKKLCLQNVDVVFQLLEKNYFSSFSATQIISFLQQNELERSVSVPCAASDSCQRPQKR